MKLTSQYKTKEIIKILHEEVDHYPSIFRSIITLNVHYYQGTSPVCGVVADGGFELKNRKGSGFSLIAKGRLIETDSGADIEIDFSKPFFPDIIGVIFFNRYEHDRNVIIDFLKDRLKAELKAQQSC